MSQGHFRHPVPDFEQLAMDYEEVRRFTSACMDVLAADYGVSKSTMYRWVTAARAAGHIEPARKMKKT